MNEELICLDLDDPTLFYREKCPENVPVLESSSNVYDNIGTGSAQIQEKKDKTIPHFIKTRELSNQEQQRLANEFSEYALKQSMQDAIWYHKQGNKIKSYIGLIWNGAKRYCSS